MSKKVVYDFIVEYAKSGRATCKTSKEPIPQGEIRIGQMVQAPTFDGKIPHWHHWKWFFSKGNRGLTKWEMLYNRDKLRLEDQEKIKALIEKHGDGDKKGTKRKADASDESEDEKPAKKKQKPETPEEKALREENELLWKIKDSLKGYRPKDLREILELNDQSSKGGEDDLADRIANGVLFGALPEGCGSDECSGGHVYLDKSSGKYKCTGHSSEWSRCLWESATVDIKSWKIPKWLRENDYFKKWKFEKRERVVVKSEVVRAEGVTEEGIVSEESLKAARARRRFHDIGKKLENPLEGYVIAFAGKLTTTQSKLKSIITKLGGTTSTKITPKVTHLISTEKEVKAETAKIEDAVKYDIPILSEDWIHQTKEKKKEFLDQKEFLIGGSDYAQSCLKREFSDPADEKKKDNLEKTKEKKVKLVMKGRAAVDPTAGDDAVENYHVLDHGGTEIYNVVLNLTDISTNTNSYYGLQILEHDKQEEGEFILFRKWGRIGTKSGGTKLENFSEKEDAIDLFEELYLDKTGNKWSKRDKFEKKINKFFPIEIDYNQGDDDPLKKARLIDDKKSKLDARVQNLVSLIFNLDLMEESLLAMEIDLKKMPLGKLSKQHIQKGYKVLTEIDEVLKDDTSTKKASDLLRLTNQFYTLIPHDFGVKEPPLINDKEELQKKMKLMEALIDIEIATTLMKEGGDEGESKVDTNYKKLKTELTPINADEEEFKMVQSYMQNQRGKFNLRLIDAFKVNREGEDARFQKSIPLGNRQLLWHGSRVSNYVGILSQGLRIAPPEAPKSGYRFGKGIYFADICEKSAHYCRGGGSKDTILMMLVDVALGKMKELLNDQYMEQPLPGSNSTKAMGAIAPKSSMTTKEGVTVPYGVIGNTGIRSSCMHNEYIVYSIDQACIRYLLKIELNE